MNSCCFLKPLSQISLRYSGKFRCAKKYALSENFTLSVDDRQALETIISAWWGLSPEVKITILMTIENEQMERLAG